MNRQDFINGIKEVLVKEEYEPFSDYQIDLLRRLHTVLVKPKNKSDAPIGENEIHICIEECSELTQALTKILRGDGDPINLLEELADVQMVIELMKIVFNVNEKHFKAAYAVKQKRLNEIIRDKITDVIRDNPENYWSSLYEGLINGVVKVDVPGSVYMKDYNVSHAINLLHVGPDDGSNNPNPNAGTLLPEKYGNSIVIHDDYGREFKVDVNELAEVSKFQKERMNRGENPNKIQ